jgi:hypothetical protein
MCYFTAMKRNEIVNCPYCGEMMPRNASACPHCGSDERTGWSNQTYLDGIELGEEVDYEEVRRNEFSPRYHRRLPIGRIIIAAAVLLLFIVALLRSLF